MSVKRGFLRGKEINRGKLIIIEKGGQCRSLKTFSGGRKSTGAKVPVVRRSVSVNVTDAVTQSITDDAGM